MWKILWKRRYGDRKSDIPWPFKILTFRGACGQLYLSVHIQEISIILMQRLKRIRRNSLVITGGQASLDICLSFRYWESSFQGSTVGKEVEVSENIPHVSMSESTLKREVSSLHMYQEGIPSAFKIQLACIVLAKLSEGVRLILFRYA